MSGEENLRVSVIIPVHNGAAYLADAIESVLAQCFQPCEIIVIDDGSTDTSARVIGRFSSSVRAFHQQNRGTGAARNHGVEVARGTFLAFLDQDDVWEASKLTAQAAVLDAEQAVEAVFGLVQQFHSPELGEDFRQRVRCPEQPIAGYLPSAMLIRREAFQRVGPFGESWQLVEWTDWFVRAIEQGLNTRLIPQVVTRRRLHEGNKGLALRSFQHEYPRILKALLDRRRARSAGKGA